MPNPCDEDHVGDDAIADHTAPMSRFDDQILRFAAQGRFANQGMFAEALERSGITITQFACSSRVFYRQNRKAAADIKFRLPPKDHSHATVRAFGKAPPPSGPPARNQAVTSCAGIAWRSRRKCSISTSSAALAPRACVKTASAYCYWLMPRPAASTPNRAARSQSKVKDRVCVMAKSLAPNGVDVIRLTLNSAPRSVRRGRRGSGRRPACRRLWRRRRARQAHEDRRAAGPRV